jgi:hypothetical protein
MTRVLDGVVGPPHFDPAKRVESRSIVINGSDLVQRS